MPKGFPFGSVTSIALSTAENSQTNWKNVRRFVGVGKTNPAVACRGHRAGPGKDRLKTTFAPSAFDRFKRVGAELESHRYRAVSVVLMTAGKPRIVSVRTALSAMRAVTTYRCKPTGRRRLCQRPRLSLAGQDSLGPRSHIDS
jgi:hypothetical protein